MELILLIIGLFFDVIVASLVLIRDRSKRPNQMVVAVALSLIFWQLTNFLADQTSSLTVFWNSASFIGPLFILFFSNLFIVYLKNKKPDKNLIKIQIVFIIIQIFLSAAGLIVKKVTPRIVNNSIVGYNPIYGNYYIVYIVIIFFFMIVIVLNIHKSLQQATGKLREQIVLIKYGALIAIILAVVTNVVLPDILSNSSTAEYAPLASVIFMGVLSYAIIRHRLFDINFVIARSVGYIVTLAFFMAFYASVIFFITKMILNLNISISAQIWLSATIAVASSGFPSLKRKFDSITDKIFYKDSYNAQDLLDDLNKVLVSNTNLKSLLKSSSDIIEQYLKAEFCYIGLKDNKKNINFIGNYKTFLDINTINTVLDSINKQKDEIIITDLLSSDQYDLIEILQSFSISMIIEFRIHNKSSSVEESGILILGNKKSGSVYLNNDYKVVSIITKELAISIQNAQSYEKIRELNNDLKLKIDQATKKLRNSNEKLKQLDESKDDFISMASHQLRTPLTSVKGYLSMVLDGDTGKLSKIQHEMLSQAFISSQRMVYLIADLLNVSRLKTGKFIIESTKVNLAQMITQEISQLKDTAEARSLKLIYQKPDAFPDLILDETKIRQVIMNFIDNAIYYTPAGGKIKIQIIDSNKTVEFKVEDDGIGVPKSEQQHLFTKFYRATNARKARPDGTGIGLYMAKKVILAEHGSIIFDSREGKGSTFGFILNKAKLVAP